MSSGTDVSPGTVGFDATMTPPSRLAAPRHLAQMRRDPTGSTAPETSLRAEPHRNDRATAGLASVLLVLGAVSSCSDGVVENDGPPPVEVSVSIKDASNTCITHQTEKEKLATCSDLEFIDLDGDAKMRIFDESGREIGESDMPNTSGWQDGKLIPGWSFSAVTEPTTSRTLTITAHGCDLNGSRRGQAVVVKPRGSKLAEGKGPSGKISPHKQVELFLEVVDDPHTGQMRCLAATRPPRHHPLDER